MRRHKIFYVYILASKSRRLYVGVTSDLQKRHWEHASGMSDFTSRYRINRLVYYEIYRTPQRAIAREKEIKGWLRARKVALIQTENPTWEDLSAEWEGPIGIAKQMDSARQTGLTMTPRVGAMRATTSDAPIDD